MARAHARRAKGDARQHPCLANQCDDLRRKCRCPGVAGFQLVENAVQLRGEAAEIDLIVFQASDKVAITDIEQLHQPMLDLDIVVTAGKRKTGSSLQRATALLVKLADERSNVEWGHARKSPQRAVLRSYEAQ